LIVHNGFRLTVGLLAGAFFALVGLVKTAQDGSGATLSVLALLLAAGMPFFVDNSLNDAIKKRRLEIRMEFPEFVNKLTLLVNAGMTISHAWKKIVDDNKKDTALYREMGHAMAEISAGKPEAVAYEELARRCNIKEVTKVVSIIIINLKRGGTEVVMSLKQQGDECWEMRKAAARQLGEEASTKILFPLMIMFMGIIIIVATPAVLAIAGGT
jgi:tight adherence protein C